MKRVILLVLCLLLCVGCADNSDEQQIRENIDSYFSLIKEGKFEESQQYLDKEFDYVDKAVFDIENEEALAKVFSEYTCTVDSVTVEEGKAAAKLTLTHPNVKQILGIQYKAIGVNMIENAQSKALIKSLENGEIDSETTTAYLHLKKKNKNWEIVTGKDFVMTLYIGKSPEMTPATITENEKKIAEEESYIDANIILKDFLVSKHEGYTGTYPALSAVSIKNNGDKDITSLVLKLDFLGDDNEVVESKDIEVIGMLDSPIKAGYSWKMDDDEFLEIENLDENINCEAVEVSISEAQLREPKEATLSEEEIYIDQYIDLVSAKVSMCTAYDGTRPGISHISIKNNGDRNITQLTVTVYFQDENGNDIAEDSFLVIGGLFGGNTLKANYSWKMQDNKFYDIENLADEVDLNRYRVKVTSIDFE